LARTKPFNNFLYNTTSLPLSFSFYLFFKVGMYNNS
jgi:hypothetical protein